MASTAVSRIAELIKRQPENENRREFANTGNSANGNNAGNNIAINGAAARRPANDDAFLLPAVRSRRTR